MIFLLIGVLALVVGGCVCVVWAERGGPPWARVVAKLTLFAAELASSAVKSGRRTRSGSSSSDD